MLECTFLYYNGRFIPKYIRCAAFLAKKVVSLVFMLLAKSLLGPSWHTVHATEIETDQSELSTRGKLSFPTS